MAEWLVLDSLYRPEQFFCSHLDSYGHYLREAGEGVTRCCLTPFRPNDWLGWMQPHEIGLYPCDVAFFLDGYGRAMEVNAKKRIAQVAAITSPLPWEVRRADGSPVFDLVVSSLRWMVKAAEDAGCRAAWMPLAFDHRALVCGMAIEERDIPCLVLGTLGPNHGRRAQSVRELGDLVTVAPPTFGRNMFALLARARSVLNVHAEWARGEANNMRMFETTGMGARLITDGPAQYIWGSNDRSDESVDVLDGSGWRLSNVLSERSTSRDPQWMPLRERLEMAKKSDGDDWWGFDAHETTLAEHSYIQRVPELIALARSL